MNETIKETWERLSKIEAYIQDDIAEQEKAETALLEGLPTLTLPAEFAEDFYRQEIALLKHSIRALEAYRQHLPLRLSLYRRMANRLDPEGLRARVLASIASVATKAKPKRAKKGNK